MNPASRKPAVRRLWSAAALLLGLALAIGACAPARAPLPPPGEPISGPEAKRIADVDRLIQVAQDRMGRQRYLLAIDAYRAALGMRPGPAQESRIRLGLARAYEGSGQRPRAVGQLRKMPLKGGQPEAMVQGALLRGELERKMGQDAQAAAFLRVFLARPPRPLSKQERMQALQMLLQSQSKLGQWSQATESVLEMIVEEGRVSPELDQQLAQVASRASSRELEQFLGQPRPPAVNAALLLALARAQLREGRLEEAAATLDQAQGIPAGEVVQAEIRALKQDLNQARLVSPGAVGVILPLSGNYAAYGRQVLAAVELGLGLFSPGLGPGATLYIEDSKSQASEAAAAVTRLVDQRKVMAVIGPMGAATSLAAARQAQNKQVPLITLSQVEGITKAGQYVFQNSLTPAQQVEALLHEAMDLRHKNRFAIIAPANAYGKGFSQLFAARVAQRQGQVVDMETYSLQIKDFAPLVKRISGLPPGQYRPGAQDAPRPVIKFQALFMPDGPERAAMLLPQLFYHDLDKVLVMGTSLWYDPKLLQQAGRFMGNTIFPVGFNPTSPRPEVKSFVQQYQDALGRPPGLLEAQAYDAALALRSLLHRAQPPRTRQAMREALAALRGLDGVCGVLNMSPERRLIQPLTMFTVGKDRKFRPVEEKDRLEPEPAPLGEGLAPGQGMPAPPQAPAASTGGQAPASGRAQPQIPSEPRTPAMPSGARYPAEARPAGSQ